MKKIIAIIAAIAILFGVGVTVQKTENSAHIPVGGAETAYIPVGGTSQVAYNSTDTGTMTVSSIPVGGT